MEFLQKQCQICTFNNFIESTKCFICDSVLSDIDKSVFIQSIEASKRETMIQENIKEAHEKIPESFFRVDMIYIPLSINNVSLIALVDTGAQITIISEKCAEKCALSDLIDYRSQGTVLGVGTQKILGRVHCTDIQLGDYSLPCGLTILQDFDMDIILGLDMLYKHNIGIDFKNHCLNVGNNKISFVKKD